ncbi:MAG TPA: glycosyltransferase [Nitrospira sp.]|nr:glycosyltransferase [Nitrospira sp.]
MPAYNEGGMVRKAVDACAAAEYSAGKLEIPPVDDRSTDDTWDHIQAAARERPGLVRTGPSIVVPERCPSIVRP